MDEARKADAKRLMALVESPGWPVLKMHLDSEVDAGRDYILSLMNSKPESLTGRTALRHGMRVKAYTDLGEWIESQVQLARRS